jgi:transcriptional regulator with XRE-family HTH domain
MKLLEINDQFFRNALHAANKSQREMARHMELDPSAITLMFQGRRAMQLHEAQQIAQFLGIAIEDVLRNAGLELSGKAGPATPQPATALLAGTVDAKGELHLDLKAAKQQIDAPPRLPADTVAVRASGDVFQPTVMRGALLFFKPSDVVEPSAVGRLSVVRLGNRKLHLAHVAPGFDFDRYNLIDSSGEKENMALTAATPILWIKP